MADTPDTSDTILKPIDLYKREIEIYEKDAKRWEQKAKKIINRYRDERGNSEYVQKVRFNILYSNIQVLMPATYGRNPKADIERRFNDDDDLGRIGSDILERCCNYFVYNEKFGSVMKQSLLDRLLAGRGVAWARYIPHFRDATLDTDGQEISEEGFEISDDVLQGDDSDDNGDDNGAQTEPLEEVHYEEALADYVHWQDFGHNFARTWEEVYLVWRKVYLTRQEGVERFGEDFKDIPLDYTPESPNESPMEQALSKATIYECWDSKEKKVYWINKDATQFLDEQDDPLGLPDFFPCAKPLFATLANDSLIPVPDYTEYQDQAQELDEITARISAITKCIKAAGAYNGAAPALERILAEGGENMLVPAEQWAALAGSGGLEGAISFLPIKQFSDAMLALYEARDKVKSDLYEITGIADIIRGNSNANETATAQQIKGRYATLRLSQLQTEMAEFSRDMVKRIAVIIASHFSMDTIKKICGVKLLTTQEKQQIQMQQQQAQMQFQQAQQMGQQIQPPPPLDDKMQELMDNPTWEEIEQLFRNEPALCFKIDIETDSTIKQDQEEDKQAAVEFLSAASKFLVETQPVAQMQPEMLPLLGEMLMFGVRHFRAGKSLEGEFKITMNKLKKIAEQPKPPQPNPDMMRVQADAENNKQKMAMEQQKATNQHTLNQQKMQNEFTLEQQRMANDVEMQRHKIATDAQVKTQNHQLSTEAASKPAATVTLDGGDAMSMVSDKLTQMAAMMAQSGQQQTEALTAAVQAIAAAVAQLNKPRQASMVGSNGKLLTAEVRTLQ